MCRFAGSQGSGTEAQGRRRAACASAACAEEAWAEDYNDALSIAGAEDLVGCECPMCEALMPEEDWDFCALHVPCARCSEPMQRGDPEDYCEECLEDMG